MKRLERTKVEKKIKENFFSFIICIHATNDPFDDDEKGYKSSLPQFLLNAETGWWTVDSQVRGLMNLKLNYPRWMFAFDVYYQSNCGASSLSRWCDERLLDKSVDGARFADCERLHGVNNLVQPHFTRN